MDKYKISAEEFEKVRYKRLANSPGASSAYGESRLKGDALKARMDEPFILFMEKLNALISLIVGSEDGDSILKHIPTGINPSHTLYDLLGDISSDAAEFASYLSVGDKSLLERLLLIDSAIKLLNEHKSSRENPHGVTAAQVGLGKVNNTSDEEKPLSLAVREALKLARDGAHDELIAAIAKCLKNEGLQVLDGSLTISGDIFVGGEAKAKQLESLLIEDACIVANAEGVPLAELSGYVIRVTESEAYAIVYDPFDECVKIGLGVYDGDAKVFTFNESEAQALATRGDIKGGNIPVWNDEKKRFEDSGVSARAVSDLPSMESVAGALRGSASGTVVALKDVSKISHGLGVRVSSKNLIPFSYRGRLETIEGVTFTVNDDGSVTANGTATNRAQFLIYSSSLTTLPLKAGTYTLSGCPQGGGDATYGLWSSKGQDHGKGKTFTLTEDTEMFLNITIMAGVTVNNLTFYPQIEIGTAATAYTPYVADTEAVKIKAQGKNLINIDADMVTSFADVEKLDFKTFKIARGIGSAYFPRANIYLGKYKDYKGKTITASIKRIGKTGTSSNTADILYICNGIFERAEKADFPVIKSVAISGTDNTSNASVAKITIPNDLEYEDIYFRIYTQSASNDGEYSIYSDFQVELGETATEYEPYIEPIEYGPGEVIKSIYPSTTLTTDTPGAIIEVDYNRDINKAFAELQQAIISLGGII